MIAYPKKEFDNIDVRKAKQPLIYTTVYDIKND